jgi:hypothetical protein
LNEPLPERERLCFLARVVRREASYLCQTDQRLFAVRPTLADLAELPRLPELSERIDAFVARLSRLQDGTADKLLPALLAALGETPAATIDNLNRAERLGWLASSTHWMTTRRLRNRLVHEYVEDAAVLLDALQTAHDAVPMLSAMAERLADEVEHRFGPC